MPNKFYSLPKSVFEHYHAKIKDWVRAVLPTKTSDLTNDSDFLDQLALAGIIAVTFSASSTYKVGDYVLYNHTLYRCKTAITTAGAWDASKWDAAKTQDIFQGSAPGLVPTPTAQDVANKNMLAADGTFVPHQDLSEYIKEINLNDIIAEVFSTSKTYAVGDYVIHEKKLYRCTTAVSSAGNWSSSNWTQVKSTDIFQGSAPGLVPAAESGDADKVLKGDGTWGEVEAGSSVRISYDAQAEELHMDFSTPLPPNKVRVDGIVYNTKVLGTQEWMIQNLRSPIGTLDVDYKIRNSENIEYDGLYYNLSALFDSDGNVKSDVLNIIPSGWRLPNLSDVNKLQSFGNSGTQYYWYQNRSDYEVTGFNATESGAYILGEWNNPTYLFQMWVQGFANDDPRLNRFIEMSYKDSTWVANNWIQLEWNPYFVVRLVRDVT